MSLFKQLNAIKDDVITQKLLVEFMLMPFFYKLGVYSLGGSNQIPNHVRAFPLLISNQILMQLYHN